MVYGNAIGEVEHDLEGIENMKNLAKYGMDIKILEYY